jgi:type II secretory pathway component GspD/PulD (secretin)
VLSEPRITVLNGYSAEVFVGEDVPVQSVKVSGSWSQVHTTFKKVGITLQVTPFIIGDDTIRLELHQDVANVIGYTPGGVFTPPNPIVRTRNAKTTVNIKDGSTYIIGGLISTVDIETEVKTPILGDIPLVGYLFRYNRTQKENSRLIFFITPRVRMPMMKTKEKLIIPPGMNR